MQKLSVFLVSSLYNRVNKIKFGFNKAVCPTSDFFPFINLRGLNFMTTKKSSDYINKFLQCPKLRNEIDHNIATVAKQIKITSITAL